MTNYDEVPYPSYSYAFTHPDTLALLATLMGLRPAPVERCRVLELGCASGGNLIPMALGLPGSHFVGVDASGRQIAEGQRALSILGLKNIGLETADILDIDDAWGQFDYIIAHGVFSWVPELVQEQTLEICARNLAPNGVAYISYNAYPGWHMLGTFRHMMRYHTRNVPEPEKRVAGARSLLQFLHDSMPEDTGDSNAFAGTWSSLLRQELERWQGVSDAYVLHDELEELNQPFYFHEFAERASGHGLQYLSEVDFSSVFLNNYPASVKEKLLELAHDIVEMEQYIDFLQNRVFRRTLLVHQDAQINRSIRPQRIAGLNAASKAQPVSAEPDMQSVCVEQYRADNGAILTTDHPVTKAAMAHLHRVWPQVVPIDTLLDAAYALLNTGEPSSPEQRAADAQLLRANLLRAFVYSDRLVELHSYVPAFVTELSERPIASPWARYLARTSAPVTNVRHERVELRDTDRYLLHLLDGTRDRDDIATHLGQLLAKGVIKIDSQKEPIGDPDEAKRILANELESDLHALAQAALLVG